MVRRILASNRFIALIALVGTFLGALMLLVLKAVLIGTTLIEALRSGAIGAMSMKTLAVGLIEVVDVFLIAIAMHIISLSLYALFEDDSPPLPPWMEVRNLENLKASLVSVVIAVLAVLFLREAVAWKGERPILQLGAAMASVIAALTFYLGKHSRRGDSPDHLGGAQPPALTSALLGASDRPSAAARAFALRRSSTI